MTNCINVCLETCANDSLSSPFNRTYFMKNLQTKLFDEDINLWTFGFVFFFAYITCRNYSICLVIGIFLLEKLRGVSAYANTIISCLNYVGDITKNVTILKRFEESQARKIEKKNEAAYTPCIAPEVVETYTINEEPSKCILIVGRKGSGRASFFKSLISKVDNKSPSYRFGVAGNIHGSSVKVVQYRTLLGYSEPLTSCTFGEHAFDEPLKQLGGLHAVVYCFSLDHDFSKKDTALIQQLKHIFGPQIVKDSLILLVSDGRLVRFNKDEIKDFDNWLRQRSNKRLNRVLKECNFRGTSFIKVDEIHKNRTSKIVLRMVENNIYQNASQSILNKENTNKHEVQEEQTVNQNVEAINKTIKEEQVARGSFFTGKKISPREQIEQESEISDNQLLKDEFANKIDRTTEVPQPSSSNVTMIMGGDENQNDFPEKSSVSKERHLIYKL